MKAVFVTGTDTGVGKTVICGLLGRYLLDRGRNVITQKWIQTGSQGFPEDLAAHLKLMGRQKKDVEKYLHSMTTYTFSLPVSPHLAAAIENKRIDSAKIKGDFRRLSEQFDSVIVEGVGGVLVPYGKRGLVIDIVKELDLPAIIVAQNKLGAINHTLLTIEALSSRRIKVLGVIFNEYPNEDTIIAENNPKIVKMITGRNILGTLPWLTKQSLLRKAFRPIGDNILKAYAKASG
jgi:dethiobiotin synthetase